VKVKILTLSASIVVKAVTKTKRVRLLNQTPQTATGVKLLVGVTIDIIKNGSIKERKKDIKDKPLGENKDIAYKSEIL
jgi:hypothetical protein